MPNQIMEIACRIRLIMALFSLIHHQATCPMLIPNFDYPDERTLLLGRPKPLSPKASAPYSRFLQNIQENDPEQGPTLLNQKTLNKHLIDAIEHNDQGAVKDLINEGADVNYRQSWVQSGPSTCLTLSFLTIVLAGIFIIIGLVPDPGWPLRLAPLSLATAILIAGYSVAIISAMPSHLAKFPLDHSRYNPMIGITLIENGATKTTPAMMPHYDSTKPWRALQKFLATLDNKDAIYALAWSNHIQANDPSLDHFMSDQCTTTRQLLEHFGESLNHFSFDPYQSTPSPILEYIGQIRRTLHDQPLEQQLQAIAQLINSRGILFTHPTKRDEELEEKLLPLDRIQSFLAEDDRIALAQVMPPYEPRSQYLLALLP